MDLSPALEDRLSHGSHHIWKQVRSNVRMSIQKNSMWSSMLDKYLVDFPNRSPLGRPGIEFTVGKRAGPTLAKAVIGILDYSPLAKDRG